MPNDPVSTFELDEQPESTFELEEGISTFELEEEDLDRDSTPMEIAEGVTGGVAKGAWKVPVDVLRWLSEAGHLIDIGIEKATGLEAGTAEESPIGRLASLLEDYTVDLAYIPEIEQGKFRTQVAEGVGQFVGMASFGGAVGGTGRTVSAAERLAMQTKQAQGAIRGASSVVKAAKEVGSHMASPTGFIGSAQMSYHGFSQAKEDGATDRQAYIKALYDFGLGATEAIPIARAIERMDKATGGGIKSKLIAGASGYVDEFAQEYMQTFLSNVAEEQIYNQGMNIFEDVMESGVVGGTVGAIVNIMLTSIPGNTAARRKLKRDATAMLMEKLDDTLKKDGADKEQITALKAEIQKRVEFQAEEDSEINEITESGNDSRDVIIDQLVEETTEAVAEEEFVPTYTVEGSPISKADALLRIEQGILTGLSVVVNDADTQRLIDLAKESKKVAKAEKQAKKVEKPTPEVTVTKEEEVKPEVKLKEKEEDTFDLIVDDEKVGHADLMDASKIEGTAPNDVIIGGIELFTADDNRRGMGYGTNVYRQLIDKAAKKGKRLVSVFGGQTIEARRVWDGLVEKGEATVEEKNGEYFYKSTKVKGREVSEVSSDEFLDRAVRGVKKENVELTSEVKVGDETHAFKIETQEDGTQTYSKTVTKPDGTTQEVSFAHLGEIRTDIQQQERTVREQEKKIAKEKVKEEKKERIKIAPAEKWLNNFREGKVTDTKYNREKATELIQKELVPEEDLEAVKKFAQYEAVEAPVTEEVPITEVEVSEDLKEAQTRLNRADNMLKAGNNPADIQAQLDIASEELAATKKDAVGYETIKTKLDELQKKNEEVVGEAVEEARPSVAEEVDRGVAEEARVQAEPEPTVEEPTPEEKVKTDEEIAAEAEEEAIRLEKEEAKKAKSKARKAQVEKVKTEARIAVKAALGEDVAADIDEYMAWRDEQGLPKMKAESEKNLRKTGSKWSKTGKTAKAIADEYRRLKTTTLTKRQIVEVLVKKMGLSPTQAKAITNELIGKPREKMKVKEVEEPKKAPEAPKSKLKEIYEKLYRKGYKHFESQTVGGVVIEIYESPKGYAVIEGENLVKEGIKDYIDARKLAQDIALNKLGLGGLKNMIGFDLDPEIKEEVSKRKLSRIPNSNLLVSEKDTEVYNLRQFNKKFGLNLPIERIKAIEAFVKKAGIPPLKIYITSEMGKVSIAGKNILFDQSVGGTYDNNANVFVVDKGRVSDLAKTAVHEYTHSFEQMFLYSGMGISPEIAEQFGLKNWNVEDTKDQNGVINYIKGIEAIAQHADSRIGRAITAYAKGTLYEKNPLLKEAFDLYFKENPIRREIYQDYISTGKASRRYASWLQEGQMVDLEHVFYGLTDASEFVSEATSNTTFATILSTIPSKGEIAPAKISNSLLGRLFDRILNMARDVFGVKLNLNNTVLGEVILFTTASEEALLGLSEKDIAAYEKLHRESRETREFQIKKDTELNEDHNKKSNKLRIKKYNSEKAARIKFVLQRFKFIHGTELNLDELKSLVRRVNTKLSNVNKISDTDMMQGWRNYYQSISRKRAYAKDKALKEAEKKIALGETNVAKEKIIDYIKSSIKGYVTKVQVKELKKLLNTINATRDNATLLDTIEQARLITADINSLDIIRKFKTLQKSIKPGKRKLDVKDSGLWKTIKRARIDVFGDENIYMMEEIVELMKKPIDNYDEINNWVAKYLVEEARDIEQRLVNEPELTQEDIDALEDEKVIAEKRQRITRGKKFLKKARLILDLGKKIERDRSALIEGKGEVNIEDIDDLIEISTDIMNYAKNPADLTEKEQHYSDFFLNSTDLDNLINSLKWLYKSGAPSQETGKLIAKVKSIVSFRRYLLNLNTDKIQQLDRTDIGRMLNALRSTPLLISEATKFDEETAQTVNAAIFAGLRAASSRALTRAREMQVEIRKVINRNKLKLDDFITVSHYANILTTRNNRENSKAYLEEIERNIKHFERALKNKLRASEANEYKHVPKKQILREIELFNKVKEQILNNDVDNSKILTDGQKEYYDFMRNALDLILPEIKHTSNINIGEIFEGLNDYFPLQGVGLADDKGHQEELMSGLQVDKILTNPNKTTGMDKIDNNHIKERTGSKKAFYNNNSFAVFEEYMGAVLYDIHTAREIHTIHTLLSAKATKEVLGHKNVAKFYERAKHSINISRRKVSRYSSAIRWLEKIRGNILVGQVANLGQWAKQVVSMLPANIAMNPKGFPKAMKIMTTWSQSRLDEWFNKYGAGLQRRDVFMEKLGSPMAYSNRLARMSEKNENMSSTAIRKADAFSARISFLAAFFEKGGNMESPDPEMIAQAEFITDLVQNVSDPSFAGTAWNPESNQGRIMMSMMYHLKTFAVNYSLGALGGVKYAKNSAMARRLAVQAYMGSAIFGVLTEAMRDMTKLAFGIDDEDDRDTITRYIEAALTGAAGDLLFAMLPSVAESMVKGQLNAAWKKYSGAQYNIFYADPSLRAGTGGYASLYDGFNEGIDSVSDMMTGDFSSIDAHDWAYVASSALAFVPLLPMRGDIKRGLDAWHKAKEQEKKIRNRKRKVVGGEVR
jgi:hypothetical protein